MRGYEELIIAIVLDDYFSPSGLVYYVLLLPDLYFI